jgi:predicted lipoprotein with Yx(FWY)xxD motif
MRRAPVWLILPLALLAAACGSSSSTTTKSSTSAAAPPATTSATTSTSAVKLGVASLPKVGAVLVNGQGRTLYVFIPDHAKKVTCVGGCASIWPPLTVAAGQKPAITSPVQAKLVSSDPDPSGGQVVTYNGWPLYLYVADPGPGTDHGEGVNSSGGLWYAIRPTGALVRSTGGTSTTDIY